MAKFFRYKKICLFFIFAICALHAKKDSPKLDLPKKESPDQDLSAHLEELRSLISSRNLSNRLKNKNLTMLKTENTLVDEAEIIFVTCLYTQKANLNKVQQLIQDCVTQVLLDSESSKERLTEGSLSSANINVILLIPDGLLSRGEKNTVIASLSNNVIRYFTIDPTTLTLTLIEEKDFS